MVLALTEVLNPLHVFVLAFIMGLARPSDLVMRNALIGQSIPTILLSAAMSASRTTTDSARVAGALMVRSIQMVSLLLALRIFLKTRGNMERIYPMHMLLEGLEGLPSMTHLLTM